MGYGTYRYRFFLRFCTTFEIPEIFHFYLIDNT